VLQPPQFGIGARQDGPHLDWRVGFGTQRGPGGVRRRVVVVRGEVSARLAEPVQGGWRGIHHRGAGDGAGRDRITGPQRDQLAVVLAPLLLIEQHRAGLAELLHPALGLLPAGQVGVGGAALPEPELLADLAVDLLPRSGTVHPHYLVVVVHGTALVRSPSPARPTSITPRQRKRITTSPGAWAAPERTASGRTAYPGRARRPAHTA